MDVGANVGQTAERVRNEFHDAVIHSFEPVAASFEQLERTARRLRVCAHRLALGSSGGTATIGVCASSPRSSIALADHALKTEVVEMTTVDALFERLGLSRIDVLKIDTEGHDLEILRGAVNALDRRSIEFILAEVGLGRTGIHVPFDEVRDFVAERGFVWFGLYDQTPTRSGPPDLRYGNALFALGH